MSRHECDCGAVYDHLELLYNCQANDHFQPKADPFSSKRIRDSAKGEQCQVRFPGVCNRDPSTVVFAHLNGGGMGMKHPDTEGAYCCSACHDLVDGRYIPKRCQVIETHEVKLAFQEGCVRTRKILIEKGLLILK